MGENGIPCCLFLHQTTTILHGYLKSLWLYIVRFLHQTTTVPRMRIFSVSCISSVSYIKPQLSVYHYVYKGVVYRPFPTSNHNGVGQKMYNHVLYIVRFLHQTTTEWQPWLLTNELYIVRFLHQTTTVCQLPRRSSVLYIVRFLHQTTTGSQLSII